MEEVKMAEKMGKPYSKFSVAKEIKAHSDLFSGMKKKFETQIEAGAFHRLRELKATCLYAKKMLVAESSAVAEHHLLFG